MTTNTLKKRCENSDEYTYTGKESSPLGLGYTAFVCDLGTKRVGRDGTMWMVSIKNDVKVWVRIPTSFAEEAASDQTTEVKGTTSTPKKRVAKKKEVVESTLQQESVVEEVESPVPTATKKKAVTKKPTSTKPEEEVATPTPKKKAATKKVSTDDSGATTPPTRTPTKYNIYMKVRLAKLKDEHPDMPHTQRLSKAASEWRTMTTEEKDKLIAELNE